MTQPAVVQSTSSAGAASATISPSLSGCVVGNVAVVAIGVTGTVTVPAAPTGWTLQGTGLSAATNGNRYAAFYHKAVASGTETFSSFVTGGPYTAVLLEISGVQHVVDLYAGSTDTTSTDFNTNPTAKAEGEIAIGVIQSVASATAAFTVTAPGVDLVNTSANGQFDVQTTIGTATESFVVDWKSGSSQTASYGMMSFYPSATPSAPTQSKNGTATTSNPTLAYASNVGAGSLLIACVSVNVATEATVATSAGTATFTVPWTKVTGIALGTSTHVRASSMWYAVVNAGGTHTVLFTTAATATTMSLEEWGQMAIAPLDSPVAKNATGSSTAPSVTSGIPVTPYDLLIGCVGVKGSVTATDASGWANDASASIAATMSQNIEYKTVQHVAAQTASWTIVTNDWIALVAGFKLATQPPLRTQPPILQAVNRAAIW